MSLLLSHARAVPPELAVSRCQQMALCPHCCWGVGDVSVLENTSLISISQIWEILQKKTCPDPIKWKHFTHLADPLSAIPQPLPELFSVVSDSNHHTAELSVFIHSGIPLKNSSVQLNFLKMGFFLPHLPCTIETVAVQHYRADAVKIKVIAHQGVISKAEPINLHGAAECCTLPPSHLFFAQCSLVMELCINPTP